MRPEHLGRGRKGIRANLDLRECKVVIWVL